MLLRKKQRRHIVKPRVPSIYLFANPNRISGRGEYTAYGSSAARRRSSGYHTPLRFARHFITVRSEIRPTKGAPTVRP